jgi:hypothetical protein
MGAAASSSIRGTDLSLIHGWYTPPAAQTLGPVGVGPVASEAVVRLMRRQ